MSHVVASGTSKQVHRHTTCSILSQNERGNLQKLKGQFWNFKTWNTLANQRGMCSTFFSHLLRPRHYPRSLCKTVKARLHPVKPTPPNLLITSTFTFLNPPFQPSLLKKPSKTHDENAEKIQLNHSLFRPVPAVTCHGITF